MSIAFETSRSSTGSDSNPIQRLGFDPIMWRYNRPPENGRFRGGDSRSRFPPVKEEEEEYKNDSCSSSSIGRNSDSAGGGNDADDDGEVQSSMTEPFNTLSALEEVLPVKRGISTFYAGKSKSFSNLADAASASIQDISKPFDAYSRKRKNLMAHQVIFDKDRNLTSGMAKRFANSSRSTLAPGLTTNPCCNKSGESSNCSNKSGESSNSNSLPSGLPVPLLPPCNTSLPADESSDPSPRTYCTPLRSLSLSDLQHATSATVCITDSVSYKRDKEEEDH